jgi:hypothetical protein
MESLSTEGECYELENIEILQKVKPLVSPLINDSGKNILKVTTQIPKIPGKLTFLENWQFKPRQLTALQI